ncbi:MAG: helix-turn-helix transcriptional regulator [Clostridia bacterium]|nr:helix-turn-helix transcriptional regulator [Clostridia bacterium]
MGLGETIRELRIAKKMTQTEVCGDRMTRNMLSIIEHGNANPSLSTLLYLAERLDVPPGYLIAGEKEKKLYRKAEAMAGIEQSMKNRDYAICRSICEGLGEDSDPEISRRILECDFMLARDSFFAGSLRHASEGFAKVAAGDSEGRFLPVCAAYSSCISDISPSLDNDIPPAGDSPEGLSDLFTLYYFFYRVTAGKKLPGIEFADRYVVSDAAPEYLRRHIHGRILMLREQYRDAAEKIKEGTEMSADLPLPAMFFMFGDLETCFRETGDFKNAYEYSGLRRELFERFLR